MALITQSIGQDYLDMYDGYDRQAVGLGVINPNIYATPEYGKKKIQNMVIGGISEVRYAGYEHDVEPLIIPLRYESAYNTILAYNLHYCPPRMRSAILKFILDSNAARIRSNQPLIIDYNALKRAIPDSQYIVRRYKSVGIRVEKTYTLMEWPEAVKDKSKWQDHYRMIKEGRVR